MKFLTKDLKLVLYSATLDANRFRGPEGGLLKIRLQANRVVETGSSMLRRLYRVAVSLVWELESGYPALFCEELGLSVARISGC